MAETVHQRAEEAARRLLEASAEAGAAQSQRAWGVGEEERHCWALVAGAEERRCWAWEAEEVPRFLALVGEVELICSAWAEVEERRMLGAMGAEAELLPRVVVEQVETLREVEEEVRRERAVAEEELGLAFLVEGVGVRRECLALGAVEERVLCSAVEVVPQKAHDCRRTVEARRTLCHLVSRHRLRESSAVVAEVVALGS